MSIISFFNKKMLCKMCGIIYFLVFSINSSAQVFELQERQYRVFNNKWYTFFDGKKGDQIVPERLIVRLKDSMDIASFNFSEEGFEGIKVGAHL